MQLKMESSSGKSKPQSPQQPSPPTVATSSSSISSSATGSAQQHQNGASSGGSGGGVLPNGATKFRPRLSTTPSSSSLPTPTSSNVFPSTSQQYRFINTLPLRILVLKDLVGAIIGRGGGTIKQITQETHARVDVHRKESSTASENVIMIYGNPENCSQACRRILEVMQQESRSLNRTEEIVLKILASNNLIGRIIGKGGNTIKRIMQQTDTKITVSSANLASQINLERIISIGGTLENMCKAEVLISQKLRQCFEHDMYQYQQSLLYSGLHSPIPPVMAHPGQGGPLNLQTAGFSPGPHLSASALPYSLGGGGGGGGPSSQSMTGRPGGMGGQSHSVTPSATSSAGGQSSHHLHSIAGPPPPPSASSPFGCFGGYIPYLYPHGPAGPTGNIPPPGAFSSGPGSPYMNLGSYIHPAASPTMSPNVDNIKETVTVFIPNSVVGAIIGRGGQSIREMMNQSGAIIKVAPMSDDELLSSPSPSSASASPDSGRGMVERKVVIHGTPSSQYQAQYFVFHRVMSELYNQASTSASASPPIGLYGDPMILKVEILVPTNQVRRIIGKSGAVIQELQRNTGATIKLSKESPPTPSALVSPPAVSSAATTSSANGSTTEAQADKQQQQPSTSDKSAPSSTLLPATDTADLTAVHIIGDFHSSFSAQRQIRLIVLRSSNVPSTSRDAFAFQQLQSSTGQQQQSHTKGGKPSSSTTKTTTTSETTIASSDPISKSTASAGAKTWSSTAPTSPTPSSPSSSAVSSTPNTALASDQQQQPQNEAADNKANASQLTSTNS